MRWLNKIHGVGLSISGGGVSLWGVVQSARVTLVGQRVRENEHMNKLEIGEMWENKLTKRSSSRVRAGQGGRNIVGKVG